MPYADTFLKEIDVDLALREARDNVDEPWTRRALAGLSVGMPIQDAAQSAAELLSAVNLLCAGVKRGKAKLCEILGNGCDDYQRALWYTVAGRGPLVIAGDLFWLSALLERRMLIGLYAEVNELGYTKSPSPYVDIVAEAPRGRFIADFTLGEAWEGIALAR